MSKKYTFLVSSCVIVTIIAVITTRGMKKVLPFYYYKTGSNCVYVPQISACSPTSSVGCWYNKYPAYQNRLDSIMCFTPLGFD